MNTDITQNKTIHILVGSLNPVKINAAKHAIAQFYPDRDIQCRGIDTPSGVADQPMTSNETRQGAINRAKHCQQHQSADFYIAMEGGVDNFNHGPATFAYIAIIHQHIISVNRSAELPLPISVYRALQHGEELGNVMDKLFNTKNIKQQGGAIGLLTHHRANRESTYTQAITLAMAPILFPEMY